MTIKPVASFTLLDGTIIPWIAWGNGSGQAQQNARQCGKLALASGIPHIDTAQLYKTERETMQALQDSGLGREQVYITSKLSADDDGNPVPISQVVGSVKASIGRLGTIPDLFLVHNPFVAPPGQLKALWTVLEDLKDAGELKSIGVSNFRPQDLEAILEGARYKPVVNQLEYHPYTLAHLQPLLSLQAKHGILTESFGCLTPLFRHPTGGPLKPILERIASRISDATGKTLDTTVVLLLWIRAQGVVAVTSSGNTERIKSLGEIAVLPDLLEQDEVEEIARVGKGVHFRFYREHMEQDFPVPNLPSE